MEQGLFLSQKHIEKQSDDLITKFVDPLCQQFLNNCKAMIQNSAHAFSFPTNIIVPKEGETQLQLYDWKKRHKREVKTQVTFPHHYGLINLEKKAIIAGGQNYVENIGHPIMVAEVFQIQADATITELKPMFIRRSIFPLVLSHDEKQLFAVGGAQLSESREKQALQEVEKYSISKNVWTPISSLQDGRYAAAACCFGEEYLYAMCGIGAQEPLNKVERLSFGAMSEGWNKLAWRDKKWFPRALQNAIYLPETKRILVFGCDLARQQRTSFLLEHTATEQGFEVKQAFKIKFECSLYNAWKRGQDGEIRAIESQTNGGWKYTEVENWKEDSYFA